MQSVGTRGVEVVAVGGSITSLSSVVEETNGVVASTAEDEVETLEVEVAVNSMVSLPAPPTTRPLVADPAKSMESSPSACDAATAHSGELEGVLTTAAVDTGTSNGCVSIDEVGSRTH